jgi:hypothetical protein
MYIGEPGTENENLQEKADIILNQVELLLKITKNYKKVPLVSSPFLILQGSTH